MKPQDLIIPYFRANRRIIAIGMVSLVIVDILQLIIPRIIKWVVDDLTALQADASGLIRYSVYLVAVALLIGGFRFVWRYCLLGTSRQVEEGLRNRLFSHLQTLSAAYFDQARTGDLMAHATNDIQQVRMAVGMGLVALNDAVVLGAAAIAFMMAIDLRLTLLVLIPMPFIVFGTRFFSKRMHRRYRRVQAAFSELTEAIRERFTGIRIIKSHSWEAHESSRVEGISREFVGENLDLVKVTGFFFPMMVFCTNLSLAIVIYFGGGLTIEGTITPGDFVAFISYLGLLTWPMMALGWVTNLIQRGKASLDRLSAILRTKPIIFDAPGARSISRAAGNLGFQGVRFAYGENHQKTVLENIDLRIDAGSIIGVVGPPGSGKSTLLNLVPRLYEPIDGKIFLDGIDIRELKLDCLRSQISFVPQEPFLFAGTVRENITLGIGNISEGQLIAAARKAAVHDTIQSFTDGYDTVVGEKGIILSGGQKQRIALARALLLTSPLLLLDDPISQVDMETGRQIVDTIRSLSGSRTVIIVSHRIAAVRFADRIITLDSGRITESGTHEELLRNNRYYAMTHRLQEIEEDWYAN